MHTFDMPIFKKKLWGKATQAWRPAFPHVPTKELILQLFSDLLFVMGHD
jgi:hypothetical protein